MQRYFESVYGARVLVSYHDAVLPNVRAQFSALISEAEQRRWPYPLVLVDDEPVMAGHVDAYGLMRIVNEALEIEN